MYKENIKELRKELRLSAQALADKIGVSQMSISNYENGYRKPSYEFLYQLLSVYNVNINWLMTGEGNMFIGHDKANHTGIDEVQFRRLFKQCMKEEGFI